MSIVRFLLAVLLAVPVARAAPLSSEEAVRAAVSGAPAVLAAEASLDRARALRAQSLLLRDPTVEGRVGVDGEGLEVQALQRLSLTGEGRHAHRAARFEIEASEAALRRARLEAAAGARRAYLEAATRERLVGFAVEDVERAARVRDAVARQRELGEAAVLDVWLARMGEAGAAAELLEARREHALGLQALAELVRRPLDPATELEDPLAAVPAPDLQRARAERADVAAARAAVQAAEADLRRQRAAAVPPLGIGAFLERDGDVSHLGPALSVTLPLFDRNQVGRAEARGALDEAVADAAALEARAETEQTTAALRVAEAVDLVEDLGGDVEDMARDALAGIETAYRAGELDLATAVLLQAEVLDGLRATVLVRHALAEARLDLLLAVEDDALIGGP